MNRDFAAYIGTVALIAVLVFAVVLLPLLVGRDTDTKWTTCAAKCAPMAPAEYERACYCDTRTTLPPTPNED